MAHYLFNFSKKGAAKGKTLREQAAELLQVKLWGIGAKTPNHFEARIYPELELIAKTELESGAGLERRVAQEAVRELLTTSASKTAKALRKELDETRHIKLAASELAELVSELLS